MVIEHVELSNLVNTKVYLPDGDVAGTIEDLLIDPDSGIVKFANVQTVSEESLLVPWAAMIRTKAPKGFTLTQLGMSLVASS